MIKRRLYREKEKVQSDTIQENDKLTMLESINRIVDLVENSKLSKDFYEKAAPYINLLREKQGFSKIQSILVSLIAEATSKENHASLSDIADFVDCNGIMIMQYKGAIDELVMKGYLVRWVKYGDSIEYSLTADFLEALVNDQTYVRKSYVGCTGVSFFQNFYNITHERYEDKMSTEVLSLEFQRLCDDNPDLPFVVSLQGLELDTMDKIVLTHMCRHLVLHAESDLHIESLSFLYDKRDDRKQFEYDLNTDSTDLQLNDLIENSFSDGFCSKHEYRLTEKSRQLLLKEFNVKLNQNIKSDVLSCKDIIPKRLFFGLEVQQQLDNLYNLLDEENYRSVCTRLKEKGLRQGFACLFYGEPGTGKTESVLQLAQRTGRDLIQVNISEIKSMWVGESEKNIKSVFNRYRSLVRQSKLTPILLFNEADAIIGKRKEGAERSVDKMENSIQNIILQEMESLEGIMIATTNLVQNLDSAFERRFIYKVRFTKPLLDQRIQIWHSMMPNLSNDTITRLASVYDFSGGQIENIVRKCDVESILYGVDCMSDEKIEQYCKEERIILKGCQRIGFRT